MPRVFVILWRTVWTLSTFSGTFLWTTFGNFSRSATCGFAATRGNLIGQRLDDDLQKNEKKTRLVKNRSKIQQPSEYQTSLVFKWSKSVQLSNGLVFEWWSENGTKKCPKSQMFGFQVFDIQIVTVISIQAMVWIPVWFCMFSLPYSGHGLNTSAKTLVKSDLNGRPTIYVLNIGLKKTIFLTILDFWHPEFGLRLKVSF